MRIVVLDGNENHAVAATRSLAAVGHHVIVGSESSWSKAGWSRHARGSFEYPSPERSSADFIDAVIAEVIKENVSLVLPMTERTTLPISARREELFALGTDLVLPSHDVVLGAFDKQRTTALAQSLGIDVPQTNVVRTREEAEVVAGSCRFPVVLKPASSQEVSKDGQVISTGPPRYAKNKEELLKAFEEVISRCSSLLVQEFVEGTGTGYFALMNRGSLRAEFAHRRIRDVRPTGSGSALRESVEPDPRVREASLKILQELGWHGVAMVEFRLRPDGTPVFLEVNGRFWNSLALAIYSGVNFPALLADLTAHGEIPTLTTYRQSLRCRWFLGDFRHLIEVFRGAPEGYPGQFPGRMRTLLNFLVPVPGTFHDNFVLDDPLPEVGDWIDFFWRKLPAVLRKSSNMVKSTHA
jgi:predicted ATP-grasp superfamily ATP-dependent carboligase